jgi:hypothetical protein
MVIVKTTNCPRCEHGLKVSVKQMPKAMYLVTYFDSRDKNSRSPLIECPRCHTDLFQSTILKTLTGFETAQLTSR